MHSHSQPSVCPVCAEPLPGSAARCIECGLFLADFRLSQLPNDGGMPACRHCGAGLPGAAIRCLACGRPRSSDRPAGLARPAPAGRSDDLPPLHLTVSDHRRLESIGRLHFALGHPVARFLLQELERAILCRPDQLPGNVVTLGSRVLFRLEPGGGGAVRELVAPHAHYSEAVQVSALSPLGAALIGLSEGDSMPYTNLEGSARVVAVKVVAGQPHARSAPAR